MSWKPNRFIVRVEIEGNEHRELYFQKAWQLCDNFNHAMEFDEDGAKRLLPDIKRNWDKCKNAYLVKVKDR